MAVLESVGQLSDVLCRSRLVEPSVRLLLEHLVHLSSRGELKNEVDPEKKKKILNDRHL